MKLLKFVAGLVILSSLILQPAIALAVSNVNVFISFTPIFGSGITSFTVTLISAQRVDLNWTIGTNVTNVMVRGSYGRYPSDITSSNETPSDGYLVYYGNGLNTSDTSMDFDNNGNMRLYYRAWAQDGGGNWITTPKNAWTEGTMLLTIAFALIVVGFSIAGFWLKRTALLLGSVLVWIIFGMWAYHQSVAQWDIYYGLFWACMGIALALVVDSIYLYIQETNRQDKEDFRQEKLEKKEDFAEASSGRAESVAYMHPIDKIRVKNGLNPSPTRARRVENKRLGWS